MVKKLKPKRVITKAAAHRCSMAVLKNQKQPLLSCEYCKTFTDTFFHKTPPVTASENSLISQENIGGGDVIDLSF